MTVNVASIASFLTDYYAAATLLLIPLWVAMKLVAQPSRRMALSWAATGGLLWLALVCAVPSGLRVSLWSPPVETSTANVASSPGSAELAARTSETLEVDAPAPGANPLAVPATGAAPIESASRMTTGTPVRASWRIASWQTLAVAAYCAGAAGMFLWLVLGAVQAAVVWRRARAAEPGLHALLGRIVAGRGAVPRLLVDKKLPSAAAIGIWRPTILLPEWLVREADEAGMAALLTHEWTHIQRRDLWLLACNRALSVLLYLHPMYWWLRGTIQCDQELLADAAAARVLNPASYAEQLLNWSRAAGQPRFRLAMSVGLWERPSRLSRRIRTLIDERTQTALACSRRWQFGAACSVGLIVLSLSLVTLRPEVSTAAEPEKQKEAQKAAAAEPPQPASPAAPVEVAENPVGETFVIDGRVLGPDGKPFAGAKLYAIIKSAERKPPKLKDPTKEPFEVIERPGQPPLLKALHPKVVELFKKFDKDTIAADDPFLQSPELAQEMAKIMPDLYESHPAMDPPLRAMSAMDGYFRFELPKGEVVEPLEEDVTVVAVAPPLGPAWSLSHEPGSLSKLELRLAEDLPIQGRIVDHQGRPVAGATVRMGSLMASPDGTIDFWKKLAQPELATEKFNEQLRLALSYQYPIDRLGVFEREFVTNEDGRFTISGVGANRVIYKLQVSASDAGSDTFSVATVANPDFPDPDLVRRPEYRTYGATFEHKLRQQQIIEGTVRDAATGKPVPNVQVDAWGPTNVFQVTDAEGKYRLNGLSKADSYEVTAWPWGRGKQPYLNLTKTMDGTNATGPIVANFDLIRGVILRGKMTDSTGKPLAGTQVFYGAYPDKGRLDATFYPGNPNFPPKVKGVIIRPFDVAEFQQAHAKTAADGTYEMIVLPGRGVLGIFVGDQYAKADEYQQDPESKQFSGTVPRLQGYNFNAIEPLDVPDDAQEVRGDFSIELKPAPVFDPR